MDTLSGVPKASWSRSCPNAGEIDAFMKKLVEHGVSNETQALFLRRAYMLPSVRLNCNLRVVFDLLSVWEVKSVLIEGTTAVERAALVELETRGLSSRWKEIGHGLFNMYERYELSRRAAAMFRHARDNASQVFNKAKEEPWIRLLRMPDVPSPPTGKP